MEFTTSGYEDMELSTQLVIGEALRRGARVDILDRADNFILISKDGRDEPVKQATRTRADSYIAALAMENKIVTKALLRRAGIRVPEGNEYRSIEDGVADEAAWSGKKAVVKPVSTNFGQGVGILRADREPREWEEAIRRAFSFNSRVMAEEFAEGVEHRFLVIGGKAVAVLRRDPANVVGDGHSSVEALVAEKNRHPYRGEGYRSPLERIRLGQEELGMLASAGWKSESVPQKGETVFLRRNSNISTGGDSVDRSDAMAEGYKRIAEKAVRAVGAMISGADIVIRGPVETFDPGAYRVLELNFNPALHIHAFPAIGPGRRVERDLLDSLGIR